MAAYEERSAAPEPGPIERLPLPSGVDLRVVRHGPREPEPRTTPWLLVHGLASNARLWDGVGAALASAGITSVAVDQRGHGRSSKVDGPYDMATVADDLDLLLDALGWERAALAGQSWGGNVVLEHAHRHGERAVVTACVDGGFLDLQQRFPRWSDCEPALAPPRFAGTPLVDFEAALRQWHPDWPESGIVGTLGNVELRDDGTVAPWLTFERHLTVLRGLWEHRPSAIYSTIETPVLLLPAATDDGEWTRAKRAAVEEAQAALRRSRVHWFHADHDVHAQHPEAVAAELLGGVVDPPG